MATQETERLETVVVGGGQAGLRCRVPPGEARPRLRDPGRGRADRRLLAQAVGLAPRVHPGPPRRPAGHAVPRAGRRRSPRRTTVADYLAAYAARFELPVRTGVRGGRALQGGNRFVVTSGDRRFEADNVVVATGRVPAAPGSRPSRPRSIRRSCSCTPASTAVRRSCGRATSSSSAPATRGPRSPWRRPAGTGPGCRGGTRGTSRSAPGAGRTGWSPP